MGRAQQHAALPHRLQGHYCRTCGDYFAATDTNNASPHAQVWQHMFREHRDTSLKEYYSCSRYCKEREQPEEIMRGRRLYGFQIAKPSPEEQTQAKEQLDKLFPPD